LKKHKTINQNDGTPLGAYGVAAMSKELLLVVDAVANEKGVPREVIFEAMEAALASAAKKRYPDEEPDIRVSINNDTGEYETFRRWEIIADDGEMESPSYQLRLMDAQSTSVKAPRSANSSSSRSKMPNSDALPRRPPNR
jgi:hypothetical protein